MLHTVNKSPFERNSLNTCLRLAKRGSDLILIEDAVYAVTAGTVFENKMKQAIQQHSVYVLGPDLQARGISEDRIIDGIKVVDYGGFVDLVADNQQVQAWL